MDPQCNDASLFIDLALKIENDDCKELPAESRRIVSEDNRDIRSRMIWFCEEFPVYLRLIWVSPDVYSL